jgi:hypothetical protein
VTGPEVIDRDGAAAQLAALQADREALAGRAMQPWWYDALLGLFVFGFFASSVGFPWVPLVALVPYTLSLELAFDVRGAMVVAGAVLGVGIALVSRWWSRIFVAELRGEL